MRFYNRSFRKEKVLGEVYFYTEKEVSPLTGLLFWLFLRLIVFVVAAGFFWSYAHNHNQRLLAGGALILIVNVVWLVQNILEYRAIKKKSS